jgi:hypothetical protein
MRLVKVGFVAVFTLVLSVQFPSNAFADGYPCQISVETTRVNVGEWSTDSITITTKPNSFAYLGNYPKTCRTTINGGYFDEVTFNNNFDFGRTTTLRVISASFMNGIYLREGSNSVESCAVSNIEAGDFCSTAVITGYRKIEVPGYVPPKINTPPITPNSGNPAQICTQATKESKVCSPNVEMKWNYENCWSTSSNKVILEKWDKSKKKFIKVKNLSIKKSSECEKKYPKLLKFSHTEKDSKNKTYRLKFVGDNSGWEEKVKVTFE